MEHPVRHWTLYDALGVLPNATKEEIEQAYDQRVQQVPKFCQLVVPQCAP